MISPEYFERIAEGAEDIAEELHQDIINRIVKRITTRLGRGDDYILTAQDKWQLEVLQEAGFLREDLQKEIAKRTKLQVKEIKEAFEDAGVTSVEYDNKVYEAAGITAPGIEQSPQLVRLMQRGYEKTLGEWTNFTGTLANTAQTLFISECDKAYNLVSSGALSYTQAVKEAVERIAEDGVTVTYPSGHTDTIETATFRAVRTGIAQSTADITLARMEEMDWDIILVSSHLGARVTDKQDFTNHAWWQGKFYSRTGKDKKYPPFSVCGYGHVQGIDGANCRHSFGPGDGEHNPYKEYDSEENQKAYELSQRQRTLERRIRKTKRETMTLKTSLDSAPNETVRAEIEASYQRKASLLQKQNKAYNEFCEANNLKRRSERIAIAKWDRKQAAAARGAARKRVSEVGESTATQNWYSIPTAGGKTEAKYRRIAGDKTIDENVALTNPGYKSGGPGYRQNCQRCVPAYIMRKRGFDVVAKPAMVSTNGQLSGIDPLYYRWDKVFAGAKFTSCFGGDGGKTSATRQMIEWGDGAVAEIRVVWGDGTAHLFVAENNGGEIMFVDPQNGLMNCDTYFTSAVKNVTMIARIDNLQVTDLIEKCVKNRGGKP